MAFAATHILHAGSVELPVPPARALFYFTPEGERPWIADWHPEYLHGDGDSPAPGLVFRTNAGGEETLWLVTHYDGDALEAEYVRIVPNSRLGTVKVRGEAVDGGKSRVHVTYELTALSEAGNATLADFSDEVFSEMIQKWQRDLTDLLANA